MLVLTRKLSETVVVDEDIFLTVLEIQGNRVKIGIQAPDQVKILRGELFLTNGSSGESVPGQLSF